MSRRRESPRLATRLLAASAVLALLVAAAFAALVAAVSSVRETTQREAHAKDVTVATLVLEKLVVDLENGSRGLALTGQERFLRPWRAARAELPGRLDEFLRLASTDPGQRARARELARDIRAYLNDYSIPLVEIARTTPRAAREPVALAIGRRLTDAIHRKFARFLAAENELAARSAAAANRRSDNAVRLAVVGLFASALGIAGLGLYLARSIGRPVREAAAGATRIAGGDLSHRLRPGGPGEVGDLTRAFNAMAETLARRTADLEEQNELLRESERAKSELIAIVSHEVRTPLASVLGFTSLLLDRDVDEETRSRYLEIVNQQAHRLGSLLDDFLEVQHFEEGRLAIERRHVDVAELLDEQAHLYEGQSERHHVVLDVRDRPLAVLGDPDRLAQVVGNLLSNAIKYSPEGGDVVVRAARRGSIVEILVEDEGMGIPDELWPRIFTKFFRGDAGASGIPGTGLGLAYAREIVLAHGGRIDFTSEAGRGSTFRVELPAADALGELKGEDEWDESFTR